MSREVKFVNRRTIIGAVLIAVIAISAVIIFTPKQTEFPLSELEKTSLEQRTTKALNYLEEIDRGGEIDPEGNNVNNIPLDRYVAFALEYYYNEEGKASVAASEIKTLLDATFDSEFSEEDINNVGISPLMLDKNVNHDPINRTYTSHKDVDKRTIANTPIVKYFVKDMYANKEKTVFTVVYEKYTAKSPYDVIPHINGGEGIKDYLDGKGKITSIKNAITLDNVKEFANLEKETTVEYVLKVDKLVIKTVK